jgi:tetratricopeptide (TPR) repeat protein
MTLIRGLLSSIFLLFLALTSCRSSNRSASDLLKRADYYADLYNWRAASPLYVKAELLLKKNGDRRNAIHAHVGVLRLASTARFIERSQELADLLRTDRLLLNDKDLRLFALTVKGDLDGDMDQTAARQDWTLVQKLAREIGNKKWSYRAEGQLGFADYYDGNLTSCQRRVTSALIAATKAGDVGAEIFFLSTIATGYESQHLLLPVAIDYATKAIALARVHPDTGPPTIANAVLVTGLAGTGQVAQAEQLVRRLLANPKLDYVERVDYLSAAGDVALAEKEYLHAIGYLEKAATIAQARGGFREAADLQSRVSNIYLEVGDVSKAEELARTAVASLERLGVTLLLPAKFDSLAQVLVAEKTLFGCSRHL